MNDLTIKNVDFNGNKLMAVRSNSTSTIYVGISYVCKGVGLSEDQKRAQVKKVQSDLVLNRGCVKFDTGVFSKDNETIGIDIDYLPLWLAKISITPKMKKDQPEVVEKLIQYQLKAKDVLANAFIKQQHTDNYYIQREAGKIVRNMLTDTIRDKIPDSPHKKFTYPNYTRLIYKILFSKTTAQLREDKKVPKSKSLRDFFNPDELKEIQQLENIITGLISLGMGYEEIKNMLNQRYLKRIA